MVHIKKKKSVESALWVHVTQCQVPTGMQVVSAQFLKKGHHYLA